MAKYRKKPIIVEAEQFWPDKEFWPESVEKDIFSHEGGCTCKECGNHFDLHATIKTLEGKYIVCPGDWIITGVKYPCKPDIFEQTYEKV